MEPTPMTRIVSDQHGDYDLAHVISVLKIPQQQTLPGGLRAEGTPTAKLVFKGGAAQSTLLPYAETREQWLAVKQAEAHPADETPPVSGQRQ